MSLPLAIDLSQSELLCRRHGIRFLALFGSALGKDFGENSDVDLLVEFEPNLTIGYDIFDIEEDFSKLFAGRRVDFVNRKYLNPRLKDRILGSMEILHEG